MLVSRTKRKQSLAEILAGKTNPSGKLPITIEKKFEDSPGYPYKPADEALYSDWGPDNDMAHPIFDIFIKRAFLPVTAGTKSRKFNRFIGLDMV
jgi:hypothetical protein